MNEREMQIAIAWDMGFFTQEVFEPSFSDPSRSVSKGIQWHYPPVNGKSLPCHLNKLPDYFNSLDAMHEVEKSLSDEEYNQYVRILNDVCITTAEQGMKPGRYRIVSATAAQRCEAYLRMKGLWVYENKT